MSSRPLRHPQPPLALTLAGRSRARRSPASLRVTRAMPRHLLALVVALLAGAALAGPVIELAPADLDLGEVMQGTKPEGTVTIRNTGDAPLVLAKVQTSCGCTAAMPDTTTIAPGGSTPLRISFETGTRSGPQHKTVVIASNDPEHRQMVVNVTATVKTIFNISPMHLAFGRLTRGEPATLNLSVVHHSGQAKAVKRLVAAEQYFSAAIQKPTGAADAATLNITLSANPTAPMGRFAEVLRIEWEDATLEPLELAVFGEVNGDLQANPPMLFIGGSADSAQRPRKITLQNVKKTPFKILGVDSVPKGMSVTWEPVTEGTAPLTRMPVATTDAGASNVWTLHAVVDKPDQLAPDQNTHLRIRTDLPSQSLLELELRVYLTRARDAADATPAADAAPAH